MPSVEFQHLSDQDLGAIIAYVKSRPAVDRELPKSYLGPLGRALHLAGQFPALAAEEVDHSMRPPQRIVAGPTAAYGRYLAMVGGCVGCHGPQLSGGHVPGTPPDFKPAANLTPAGIGHYTQDDFFHALREGKRPDGSAIDTFMPWQATRRMSDDEIRAVYAYLRTVPSKPFGGR